MRYYNALVHVHNLYHNSYSKNLKTRTNQQQNPNHRENYPSHVHAFNFVVAGNILYYSFNIKIEG